MPARNGAWKRSRSLAVAVFQRRVFAYLKAQRGLGTTARTLVNHAVSLRHMFEALAPEIDTTWVLEVVRRLKMTVTSNKNHSDLPPIRELFEFGVRLMRSAESPDGLSTKKRAIQFRDGLIISLLAARPMMRRENIGRIKIDQNLVLEGGELWLTFNSEEMKGDKGRQAPLPPFLALAIGRYLEKHRPVLLRGRPEVGRTLFISTMGRPIYPHAMANEIGKLTQAEFGRRVNLHDFRRAAGNSVANEDPDHVGIVRELLGHTDYRTSEEFYIFASDAAAFKRFERAIEEIGRDEKI